MAADAAPDSFLQKPDADLLYVAQNPALYPADLVALASRELRRRGVPVPQPAYPATPSAYDEDEPRSAGVRRWATLAVAGVAAAGLG